MAATLKPKPIPRYIDDSEGVIQTMAGDAAKAGARANTDFQLYCYQPMEVHFDQVIVNKPALQTKCKLIHDENMNDVFLEGVLGGGSSKK